MKTTTRKSHRGFTLVELLVVIAIIVALAALATPQIFKALKRADLVEALNNVKQVKYSMDAFASDFDGQFPNDDTGPQVVEGGTGQGSSNDYFRQLFLAGTTDSEFIFWVKKSPIAKKSPPDDKISQTGRPEAALILQAGDCHWAYMRDQNNTSKGARPLILDGYQSGGNQFNRDLWDGKVVVMRIDGSAKAVRMRLSDDKILDASNQDMLSSNATAWQGSGEVASTLLIQPQKRNN
jgi:prepilin-type N-terminal cleavage/methylation domain-containing protein